MPRRDNDARVHGEVEVGGIVCTEDTVAGNTLQ